MPQYFVYVVLKIWIGVYAGKVDVETAVDLPTILFHFV